MLSMNSYVYIENANNLVWNIQKKIPSDNDVEITWSGRVPSNALNERMSLQLHSYRPRLKEYAIGFVMR